MQLQSLLLLDWNIKMNKRATLYGIVFLMGFCSLSYEIILATKFARMLGDGVYLYPAFIVLFVLSMGISAYLSVRLNILKTAEPIKLLLMVEIALTLLGFFSQIGIDMSRFSHPLYPPQISTFLGIIFGILIGLMTGLELPTLFRYVQIQKWGQPEVRRLIFFDYCASFFASVVLVLILFPHCGVLGTNFIVAFINFIICLILVILLAQLNQKYNLGHIVFLCVLGIVFALTLNYQNAISRYLINGIYVTTKNERLLSHFNTPYQQVFLFASRYDGKPFQASQEEMLRSPQEYILTAYLNDSLQFQNVLGISNDPYHTYLIDPFVYLMPKLKDILILGGGDGLPARQAVQFDSIKKITMVDLDSQWVEFTRNNPLLKFNSHNALNDPRLTLHYSDAFKWVMKTKETYDAVFVDFPEADNLAAVRTISIQFFRDVKRRLNPDGIVVVQNDVMPPSRVVFGAYQSAVEAGLYPLYGFKTDTNAIGDDVVQLLAFKQEESRSKFLSAYEKNYINSQGKEHEHGHLEYGYINTNEPGISLYDPSIIQIRWRD
jgi:spermidine synthase